MKPYRPLLLSELDLQLHGLHIRRLALNRHLPAVDTLQTHSHSFAQILCYLGGGGVLSVDKQETTIMPRSLVLIPPRCRHSFEEGSGRRALCLVIDLNLEPSPSNPLFGRLNLAQLAELRSRLALLAQGKIKRISSAHLEAAAAVLLIAKALFEALMLVPPPKAFPAPFLMKLRRVIATSQTALIPVRELARQTGYQPDYLTRLCKQATGLTLREYRDEYLLSRAHVLLRSSRSVAQAAYALGFDDANYFSRWYHKHAGHPPRMLVAGHSKISK